MQSWQVALILMAQAVTLQSLTEETHNQQYREWKVDNCMRLRTQQVQWSCSLPAGNLTIAVYLSRYLEIECEPDDSGRAGWFQCDELKDVFTTLWADMGKRQTHLQSVDVRGCQLHEPLNCTLATAGFRAVDRLRLLNVPTELRPEHLIGINANAIVISNKDNATVLPYEALATLPQLRRLGIVNVKGLTNRWQPELKRLNELELSGLVEVPARAFDGLPSLQTLRLKGHTIEKLDEGAFINTTGLLKLHINSQALTSVASTMLQSMRMLKELVLSDHRLQYLSQDAFLYVRDLVKVQISNENMSELRLETGTFSGLTKLRALIIISCGMRSIPVDLVKGTQGLIQLSLEDNQLTELPGQLLVQKRDLKILSLAMNVLQNVPSNLFAEAKSLKIIDLSENVIKFLPIDLFKNLVFLEKLKLSHNNLKVLEPKLFEPLIALKHLLLANNSLASATLMAYENHMELKTIDLSHNIISHLSNAELNLNRKVVVDLRNNNISKLFLDELDQAYSDNYSRKASFLLNNNPFMCDCNLYNFIRALMEPDFSRRFYLDQAHCAAPALLYAKPLSNVPATALTCMLDTSNCPEHCDCAVRPATARLELDCPTTPRTLPPLVPLRASAVQLRLQTAPTVIAGLPPEVRLVDLSELGLTLAPQAFNRSDDLTVDLSKNKLTVAPVSLLKSNATLRLAGNMFYCDCEHRDSIAMLERHWAQLADGPELLCQGGAHVVGLPAARLCAMRNAIILGSSLAAFGLILAVVGVLAFKYSTEIRLVLRRYEAFDFMFEEPPDPAGLEKEYDAFVSFSHRDDEFVQELLVPQLEGGRRPLRLCLHYRDWEIGGMIPEQIARSVNESRRTIVVLSREFLESTWGRVEFRAAHGLERVILLLRGDVLSVATADPELRTYLNTNTYVHEDDPLVWDRVRHAVLRSRRPRASVSTLPALTAPSAVPALPAAPAPQYPVLAITNTAHHS